MQDDELPSPPESGDEGVVAAPIQGEIPAEAFDGVPKMGEPMPAGTYHFRLEKFEARWTVVDPADPKRQVAQPNFNCQWKCQQEPLVGRVFFDTIPWVRPEDVQAAMAGDPTAAKLIKDRLIRAKALMEAAGYKPVGVTNIKEFLGSNPEVKIQIRLSEIKRKGDDGKYHSTGEFNNAVVKYLPLHRPI